MNDRITRKEPCQRISATRAFTGSFTRPSPWLSLAGLLPSMARLCFTRRIHCTKDNKEVTGEDSRKIDQKDST